MTTAIYHILRSVIARLIRAFYTPDRVITVLKIFKDLFSDDENFVPSKRWGRQQFVVWGPKTKPFTLSNKGMKALDELQSNADFKDIYRSGTAGMSKPYDLLYFLTQFLVLLPPIEILQYQKPESQEEENLIKGLLEKFKNVTYAIDTQTLYKKLIPLRKYTPEQYQEAKTVVMDIIDQVSREYRNISLTEEEKKYWSRNLKLSQTSWALNRIST